MMATTIGPERPLGPSSAAFDNAPDALMASYGGGSGGDSPSFGPQSSSRADLPPPNPHFVFPARPPSPSLASASFSRTAGRRPMSAIESPTHSFGLSAENADRSGKPTLPSFSFNPGASLPPDPRTSFLLSPPVSPNSARGLPSQARPVGHGHRRGGSEFVGGRLREGNSIAVMSTSPTKPENGSESTPSQPGKKRGHRRGVSGAISTNDLPILHSPSFDNPLVRGSSAPNSPTGFERRDDTTISSQQGLSPPVLSLPEPVVSKPEIIEPPKAVEETPAPKESPKLARPVPRARVGFSDTLEFIPRPLSLISSDASSTATARPGHSVSGSISSVVSGASPCGRESPLPLSRSPTKEMTDSRPSTAGAILENIPDFANPNASPKRRNSIPTLSLMPEPDKADSAEPSPTKAVKRWSFFARESLLSGSPSKTRPHSFGSLEDTHKAMSSEYGSEFSNGTSEGDAAKPKKSSKKKKKKVKGWAGSILPRKPKSPEKGTKSGPLRPPTPPAPNAIHNDEDDEGMYLEPEMPGLPTPTVTITESPDPPQTENSWKRPEEESSLSMIDLDAALGPFNTPLPHNPEWDAAQQAAGNTSRRQLHSAQGMKGFSGPGMHYHRRAESAPDLPPFDLGRAGIHRFGSSSTMADVFEEDEEDEDDEESRSDPTDSSEQNDSDGEATPPAAPTKDPLFDVQDAVSIHSTTLSMLESTRGRGSGPSDRDQSAASSVRAERSRSSLHDSIILEDAPSVIFRTANVFAERADTSGSATPSPKRFSNNKDLAPVDISPLHLPTPANMPVSPYPTSQASSFPSPRSPMSMDAQRISTAPSSVADENNFQSLLMGEPGPEVRISVDYDIPSLTSSNSTMTRESTFVPGPRMSQPTLRNQRPVSVESAAFGRRRSSLASLSRLISSSHGERSKLSMEVPVDNEEDNKKSKNSKTKRLGRMMKFWKPHHSKGGASN